MAKKETYEFLYQCVNCEYEECTLEIPKGTTVEEFVEKASDEELKCDDCGCKSLWFDEED